MPRRTWATSALLAHGSEAEGSEVVRHRQRAVPTPGPTGPGPGPTPVRRPRKAGRRRPLRRVHRRSCVAGRCWRRPSRRLRWRGRLERLVSRARRAHHIGTAGELSRGPEQGRGPGADRRRAQSDLPFERRVDETRLDCRRGAPGVAAPGAGRHHQLRPELPGTVPAPSPATTPSASTFVPAGTAIHRAILRPKDRRGSVHPSRPRRRVTVEEGISRSTPPRGSRRPMSPRGRAALPPGVARFHVRGVPDTRPPTTGWTSPARPARSGHPVAELTAIHRAGQTILT
jgi:hypothetical protein